MTITVRCFGPPGTGKTTWAIERVREHLAAGLHPREIGFVSFTRAAAREAAERARTAFPEYGEDDFPYFATIHSICYRLLGLQRGQIFTGKQRDDFANTFRYRFSDPNHIMEQALTEFNLGSDADAFEAFVQWRANLMLEDFDSAFQRFYRGSAWLPDGFSKSRLLLYMDRRQAFKDNKGLWDFFDMPLAALQDELCPPVKALISDESQDNSPLLFEVLKLWGGQVEQFYLCSDPHQALYQFAGGDPSLAIEFPCDETVVLRQSHRCASSIREVAVNIMSRLKHRYEGDEFLATTELGQVKRTARINLNEGTTFILARTIRQLAPHVDQLLRAAIPFAALRGPKSPLEKKGGEVTYTLLRLMDGDRVSPSELMAMVSLLPSRPWMKTGAKSALRGLDSPVGLRALKNLGFQDQFIGYLNPREFLHPFKIATEDKRYLLALSLKHGRRAFEQPPQVAVGTIHSSKGKEADNVVLDLGMTRLPWENLLKYPDAEHRVYYVGATRARTHLQLLQSMENWRAYPL